MKIKKLFFSMICVFLCSMLSACSIWEAGYENREREYYSDKNNFVTVEAECVEICTNEWSPGQYFINVKDMVYQETESCKFVSRSFVVNEENSKILSDAIVERRLVSGTTIVFKSAPRYFGDGYIYPMVSLEIDGEVILDFDVGYRNLMASYGITVS